MREAYRATSAARLPCHARGRRLCFGARAVDARFVSRSGLDPAVQSGGSRDHRRSARVNGVDDLRVVDASEIDRGDPEVGVAELSLDHDERDALAGHLNRVRVSELVWGESAADSGLECGISKLDTNPRW